MVSNKEEIYMSIRNKLLTGFTVSIIVTVLSCVIIFIQLSTIDSKYRNTLNIGLPQTYATAELSRYSLAQVTFVQTYIMGTDLKQEINISRNEIMRLITELEGNLNKDNEASQALIKSIKEKADVMNASLDEVITTRDSRGPEAAANYYVDYAESNVQAFINETIALSTEVSKRFATAEDEAKSMMNRAFVVAIVAAILAIVAGVVASYILTRQIAKPMHQLEQHVQEITKGNLAIEPLAIHSKDEIGSLSNAVNEMKATLTNLLHNLSDSAGHLSATSEQLLASTEEVNAAATLMLDGAKGGS